ncbi:MAG: Cys-Gln thioester bond-forming surface protein [Ignavibacteria bacterium]
MKKFLLPVLVFIFISITALNFSYGQYTLASVEGLSFSRDVTYTNPVSGSTETRKAGLYYGKIGNPHTGADACFYSYDVTKPAGFCVPNFDYVDDTTTTSLPKVVYIVYNYYPGKNPGVGQLSNLDNETAAIQLAIWHFTNNLNLSTITSTTVRNRAIAIAAAADLNGGASEVPTVLEITPDTDPDFFVIETKKDNGTGLAVSNIQLTISQGSLSTNLISTPASGISAPVEVIGTNNGTITAFAPDITIPKGVLFRHITNACPKLILCCPSPGSLKTTAEWGALPVELASFTSSVSGRDLTLNWSTVSELNNYGFEIERADLSAGWMKIGFVNGSGTSSTEKIYSFTERNLNSGRCQYRLKQIDYNGNFEYFNLSSDVVVGVPSQFSVSQNYPNPFNPSTKINYDIPVSGKVSVKVFDISGKEVASLVDGVQSAGYYTVLLNAGSLSSGIYFYNVNVEGEGQNFVMTKKMMLVK